MRFVRWASIAYLSRPLEGTSDGSETAMAGAESPHSSPSLDNRFSKDVEKVAETVFRSEATNVLHALTKPVGTYYVRCNTIKISSEELERRLQARGLEIIRNTLIPEALGIRIDGQYEVPGTGQDVVVDKQTAESVLQGANVYAPGIMNCMSMEIGDQVTIVSELGEIIASGKALMNANEVLTFRKGLAVQINQRRFGSPHIRELPEFSEGLLYPQSLAAMTTVRVLNPKPGETIADMNCAPGGKLSHICQLTGNSGKVLGFDRNVSKVAQARQNMVRLACANVVLSIHDSRYLHDDFTDLEVDRVLIDPPCSALGLRPKVYDFTSSKRIRDLADYQKQFVKAASEITKPGGVIVYSVCTFTMEECEQVVDFAERECSLRVTGQTPFLGSTGLDVGQSGSRCQRFHPHTHEIGYFIARFER